MFSCPALSAGPYTGPLFGFSLSAVCGMSTHELGGISMTKQLRLCWKVGDLCEALPLHGVQRAPPIEVHLEGPHRARVPLDLLLHVAELHPAGDGGAGGGDDDHPARQLHAGGSLTESHARVTLNSGRMLTQTRGGGGGGGGGGGEGAGGRRRGGGGGRGEGERFTFGRVRVLNNAHTDVRRRRKRFIFGRVRVLNTPPARYDRVLATTVR